MNIEYDYASVPIGGALKVEEVRMSLAEFGACVVIPIFSSRIKGRKGKRKEMKRSKLTEV